MSTSSKPQTNPPAKVDPAALTLTANPGEAEATAYARSAIRPAIQAGLTIREFQPLPKDAVSLTALVDELGAQCKATNDGDLKRGEAMLTAQAHTLDAIFGECARRARLNMGEYPQTVDMYLRAGLRAQSQCRATWETLATMKNPPAVFVRQANIAAGPQQVNNGAAEVAHPRETDSEPNKLLEADHERMDTRAAPLAGRRDPALATVGEIDGTKKRRG